MKPTRSLLIVFLLPILMLILPLLLILVLTTQAIKEQSLQNYRLQSNDLKTLVQMATFDRKLSDLHQRITEVLNRAIMTNLSAMQRYTEYTLINQELNKVGQSIDDLTTSQLILDLTPENALTLQRAFHQYQLFTNMANGTATLNQSDPAFFLQEAHNNFSTFTLFTQQIFEALTQRASDRHRDSYQALINLGVSTVWVGVGILALMISIAILVAWRINRRLMTVGDAILALSNSHKKLPDFKAIKKMSQRRSGSLKRVAKALMTFRDAELQRRKAEHKIHRLAYYDSLTELPNWQLMKQYLERSLKASQQTSVYGALIYIDVDDFKRINDSNGHNAGDAILTCIAERLSNINHEGCTVGRISGDEFGIIIDGLASDQLEAARKAELFAEQVCHLLTQPYYLNGNYHFLNISQGLVLFSCPEKSVEDLFQYANAAVHIAKKTERNAISFYDPAVQAELEARTELERDLRLAIEQQEFLLVYQLQVNNLGRPIGAEALIRWEHPARGRISPGVFIPLAEETGLIVPIGSWVLRAACEQLVAWQAFDHTKELVLAVNVSAKQFQQPNFVQEVSDALEASGASPYRLKLELTESTVLGKVEETIERMHQLKALGISFAIDDFGTGYSSLQYLKRLPLDQIKIDQSFVRDLHQDTDDMAIVQTIIAMGRALGLSVIAEGVETLEHWRCLNEHQCHAYQGYYFCKPVSAEEMAMLCLAPPPELV